MGCAIGLTGGVASGKTEVSRRFEALGFPVLDADVVARELVEPGEPALAEIAAQFGRELLLPDGRLDRSRMRAVVFEQPAQRARLERILHPRVAEVLARRAAACVAPIVVVAVPLLAEVGRYPWLDQVVVVDAAPALQRERLRERDRASAELAERMIAAQAPRAARLALADHVLCNSGTRAALGAQVDRLAELLSATVARRVPTTA